MHALPNYMLKERPKIRMVEYLLKDEKVDLYWGSHADDYFILYILFPTPLRININFYDYLKNKFPEVDENRISYYTR